MPYFPSQSRYDSMTYRRCGNSGIQLPLISLGLWHNFGGIDVFENGRATVRTAFDHGIKGWHSYSRQRTITGQFCEYGFRCFRTA